MTGRKKVFPMNQFTALLNMFRRANVDINSRTLAPTHSDEGERRSAAFTLIELVAVMGIIVALALLVVGGYSGMSRAIASGQGARQVQDTLLLARQTACVSGVRIYFYILDEEQYLLCRKMGTCSKNSDKPSSTDHPYGSDVYALYDYYTDLQGFVNLVDQQAQQNMSNDLKKKMAYSSILFELPSGSENGNTEPKYATLLGVTNSVPGWRVYYKKRGDGGNPDQMFKEGKNFGLALLPIRSLPKGFAFPEDDIGKFLYFEPTGTNGGGLEEIQIQEVALPDKDHTQKVKIQGGKIEIEFPK
jgi:type II secretory pathway pseudopilin PulG